MVDNRNESAGVVLNGSERAIKKSKDRAVVDGMDYCGRLDKKTEHSFFLGFIRRLSIDRKFWKPLKYRVALAKDESMVLYLLSNLGKLILSLEIATYGTFLLLFSVISFLTEGARALINTRDLFGIDYSVAIQSIILFVLSLVLIFGGRNKNLSEGILGSSIFSYLFLRILGVRQESLRVGEKSISGNYAAILIGVVLGIVSIQVSPMTVLFRIFLTILSITILCMPESGVVMMLLSLPFLPEKELLLMSFYVWLCYVFKMLLGKRSFKVTFTDATVICFGLTVLFAGIFSVGGNFYKNGILGLWLILCFVLVSTLIKNRQWIARCRMAVFLSAEIYAFISVLGTLAKYLLTKIPHDSLIVSYIPKGLPTVTRESGLFMILAVFFVFSSFKLNGERKGAIKVFFMSTVLIAGIFLTFSWEIWLAFIIGVCFYLSGTKPKSLVAIVLIAVVVAGVLVVIPADAREEIFEFANFSVQNEESKLQSELALIKVAFKNILGGIGLSENTLRSEMIQYADLEEIESFNANTFVRIIAQTGIFGILLFVFIIILVKGSYRVWGRNYKTDRGLASVGISGFASIFAFLFLGMMENVFAQSTVTMFFWLLLGLVYSSCKVMKDEAYGDEFEKESPYCVEKPKAEVKKRAK